MQSQSSGKKPIGVTMGDPSGVGPEILLRVLAAGEITESILIYGDAAILKAGAEKLGLPAEVTPGAVTIRGQSFPLVDFALLREEHWKPNQVDKASGAASKAYVVKAVEDALAGRISAIATLPISKEAIVLTSPGFIGHTELIAEMCGVPDPVMMLASDHLAVSHVTAHVPLRQVPGLVKRERILKVIRTTHAALSRFIPSPRIAACGLNPHAGESRMFGDEDADEIAPAVADARAEGIDASGPYPADTIFFQAIKKQRFDAVIAMYHDQGHAPMKLYDFDTGVNCTIGLPVVRTSVDHGTALDIAWAGEASTMSFRCALRKARQMSA